MSRNEQNVEKAVVELVKLYKACEMPLCKQCLYLQHAIRAMFSWGLQVRLKSQSYETPCTDCNQCRKCSGLVCSVGG